MEQPQYNLFHRKRVEQEYARLYDDIGLGLTTWSPLASGLLTGKYREGIPAGSRGALESMVVAGQGPDRRGEERRRRQARGRSPPRSARSVGAAGDRLGGARTRTSRTVITGASNVGQLRANLLAVDVVPRLTPEIVARIDEIDAAARGVSAIRLARR